MINNTKPSKWFLIGCLTISLLVPVIMYLSLTRVNTIATEIKIVVGTLVMVLTLDSIKQLVKMFKKHY